jgi:hypothetical protein
MRLLLPRSYELNTGGMPPSDDVDDDDDDDVSAVH